jgi:maltooligosyltrehalose trehalohydrolase
MPNVDVSSAVSQVTPVGAWRDGERTRMRVWAPEHARVEVVLDRDGRRELRPLERETRGYWGAAFADIGPGTRYQYRLNGDDGQVFPDPASRCQPEGVHGFSQVIDPSFQWTDQHFRPPRPEGLVFYEVHVGTFSPEGTFRGVVDRLPYLAQLGVTAIELMPVGDFPGNRNWGYDGVAIFAPARCYGTPDDLRRLVDVSHQHGLAVFLDVVYNHLGPDGAYANAFSPYYFTDKHRSPWGDGVNLDGPHSTEVRNFFIANALQWVRDYHLDGLRLDATHALQDEGPRHFLEEFTTTVRAHATRPVLFVAEDHRNLAQLVQPADRGGWGLDAVWADDLHHQVRVHVARETEGYYEDFSGRAEDLAATIRQGWFFSGQPSKHMKGVRGTDPGALAPRQFVVCIQNHDQIGNRAEGQRLSHDVDLPTYRAASTLLLSLPETPLLFMGQEWAATTPFLFFTDHQEELGRKVTEGRREEFAAFAAFADPELRERIPDPQAQETFDRSRLDWSELDEREHASTLRLYQRLLGLRATSAALRNASRASFDARALDEETLLVERRDGGERLWIVVRLGGHGNVTVPVGSGAQVMLTTEDPDLAPDPQPIEVVHRHESAEVRFARPGALLLRGSQFAT